MAVTDAPDEAVLRSTPPGPLAKKPWPKLVADEVTLPNGARIVTVSRRDFPTVSCAFARDRGAANVPPAAAAIYASAMDGSSEKYDANEAFEYLRYVGADVRTRAGYGVPSDGGSVDVIRKVHAKDVAPLGDLHLSPEHVTVVCVGVLEHETVVRTMKAHLGGLKKKPERPAPDLRAPRPPVKPAIILVDRPGAVQSNVAVGWIGPGASSSDLEALDVLASGVGVGLSSRLNLTVRKELGATYGARMKVRTLREASAVTLGAAIDTDRTPTALDAMLRELEKLHDEPFTTAELVHAKQRTASSFGDSTNSGVASALASEVALGQTPAHALGEHDRIEAVTSEDVRAAATRWIDVSRARIVVVGDAAKIGAGLRALGRDVEVVR